MTNLRSPLASLVQIVPATPDNAAEASTILAAALLSGFCKLSLADPSSSGVYLETANPDNLPFYERHGLARRGTGQLGTTCVWCLFHAHDRAVRTQRGT